MKTNAFRSFAPLPHACFLDGTGFVLVSANEVEFSEEPYFDDEGNFAGIERTLVPARIAAAPPAVGPTPTNKPGLNLRKRKRQPNGKRHE